MEITTVEITCDDKECGAVFWIGTGLNDRLRSSHRPFHCPNGHTLSYPGKSMEQQLRELRETKDAEIAGLRKDLREAGKKRAKK